MILTDIMIKVFPARGFKSYPPSLTNHRFQIPFPFSKRFRHLSLCEHGVIRRLCPDSVKLIDNNTPTLQKSEVFRVGIFKGEAVVILLRALKMPALDASGFPLGKKRWHQIDPILEFIFG